MCLYFSFKSIMKFLWYWLTFSFLDYFLTSLTLSNFLTCFFIFSRSYSGSMSAFDLPSTIFSSWCRVMRPAMALLLMWLTPVPVIQPGLPVFAQVTGYLCRKDLFWAFCRARSSNVAIPPFFIPIIIFWPFLDSEESYCFKSKLNVYFCWLLPSVFETYCPESLNLKLLIVSAFCCVPSTTE